MDGTNLDPDDARTVIRLLAEVEGNLAVQELPAELVDRLARVLRIEADAPDIRAARTHLALCNLTMRFRAATGLGEAGAPATHGAHALRFSSREAAEAAARDAGRRLPTLGRRFHQHDDHHEVVIAVEALPGEGRFREQMAVLRDIAAHHGGSYRGPSIRLAMLGGR